MTPSGAIWDAVTASSLATRPAVYVDYESAPVALQNDLGGQVGFIGTADFGPVGAKVDLNRPADVDYYLGSAVTPLTTALKEAFYQGASRIMFYRIASGTEVKAAHTFMDGATASLVVTAKYPGTFGNTLKAEVVLNLQDATQVDVNIYVGTVKKWTFTGLTSTDIIADFTSQETNNGPTLVTLTTANGSSQPDVIIATALTAGANGGAVASQNYHDAVDAMGAYAFHTLAVDTSDSAIQSSISGWIKTQREGGHRVFAFFGCATSATWSERKAQAIALNYEGTVFTGNGFINKDGVTITAVWAALVDAAMGSAYGVQSMTYKPVVGALGVDFAPTSAQYGEALTGGILLHTWDGNKVKIEEGINTLQPASQVAPKSRDWRKIRFMMIQDEFVNRAGVQLGTNFIGVVANNDRGRREAVRQLQKVLDQMMGENLFLTDPAPLAQLHPSYVSDGDRVFLLASALIADAVEKVFIAMRV